MSVKCKFCCNYKNKWCEEKMDSPDPNLERECFYYSQATNADRIRAMSDEELAYMLTHLHENGHCLNERCQIFLDKTCEECVVDWLKQPAEEKE